MELFSNEFFSVEMPTGWSVDDNYDGIGFISSDGTKSLFVKIFKTESPKPVKSIAKTKDNFIVSRDESFNVESTGYSFSEGIYKEDKINYKAADFLLLNKDVLVYLSFGDYTCSVEPCSPDTISGIINTFFVVNSNGDKLSFKEIRNLASEI